jgi:hypothetical protein
MSDAATPTDPLEQNQCLRRVGVICSGFSAFAISGRTFGTLDRSNGHSCAAHNQPLRHSQTAAPGPKAVRLSRESLHSAWEPRQIGTTSRQPRTTPSMGAGRTGPLSALSQAQLAVAGHPFRHRSEYPSTRIGSRSLPALRRPRCHGAAPQAQARFVPARAYSLSRIRRQVARQTLPLVVVALRRDTAVGSREVAGIVQSIAQLLCQGCLNLRADSPWCDAESWSPSERRSG